MDFYEIMLQQKLADGGGSGSSDFSTAVVTIVNNADRDDVYVQIHSTVYDLSPSFGLEPNTLPNVLSMLDVQVPSGTSTYDVVLANGHGLLYCDVTITLDGGIAPIEGVYDIYDITGNGTITIS